MNLQYRIDLLSRLGEYMLANDEPWQEAKQQAERENGWFSSEFVELAAHNIATHYLDKTALQNFASNLQSEAPSTPKQVGIIMAGNIPLVGFHDFLCVFLSGHKSVIKVSTKDQVLIKQLIAKLIEWEPASANLISIQEMLKGCDAYIATGSNNSSRYFEYYFGKFPNIIRKNRTSVAILTGKETSTDLDSLADDIFLYFGLGCRNVTKIYVPENYDFLPLIQSLGKYTYLGDHNKLKNNYDYNLALHMLNNKYYMTNGSILLVEETAIFSPISQLNYEFYVDINAVIQDVKNKEEIQCIVGKSGIAFGSSQKPSISDFADGVNTLSFLRTL